MFLTPQWHGSIFSLHQFRLACYSSSGFLLCDGLWVLESFLVWFGCSVASLVRLGGDSGQFVVRDGREFQIWFFHFLGFRSGHCFSALVLCFVSNVLENLSFVVRRTRCFCHWLLAQLLWLVLLSHQDLLRLEFVVAILPS
ncbi:unnamed protein product [Arabidopsis halleri]